MKVPKGWKLQELGEVVEISSGGTPNKQTPEYWGGDIPWLSAKDLKSMCLSTSIEKVSAQGAVNGTRYVKAGGLLILTRGMTLFKDVPVGYATKPLTFNQDLKGLTPKENVDGLYLTWCLTASKHRLMRLVDHAGHGTGRLSTDLLSIEPVLLPPLPEQIRIAEILGSWDRAIETQQKLLTAKTARLRTLRHQLLTGIKRFPGFSQKWTEYRLGCLFAERNEKSRGDLPLLSIVAGTGIVPRDTLAKRDTSNEDKSLYRRIAPGDIGYNTMRMWQGVCGLSTLDGIVSPAYTILIPLSEIAASFAVHLFAEAKMINTFWRYSQGIVDDTLSLKFPAFASIKVSIPPLPEQTRIATILNACQREIDLLTTQLEALKQQKRGMMQKLLTGEVRVNVTTPCV